MSLAAALLSTALLGVTPQVLPSALDSFIKVCATAPTMKAMEASATAYGAVTTAYPDDIRAGFLAELARSSHDSISSSSADIYKLRVAEGDAYFIFSRIEPLFGSKLPPSYFCDLRVFDHRGPAPEGGMADALKGHSINPWHDEQGNTVANWYALENFPSRRFQLSRVVSKTSLAGPANLAGLAFSVEVSGDHH